MALLWANKYVSFLVLALHCLWKHKIETLPFEIKFLPSKNIEDVLVWLN